MQLLFTGIIIFVTVLIANKQVYQVHWRMLIFHGLFQSYCQAFRAKLAEPRSVQEAHFLSVMTYPVGGKHAKIYSHKDPLSKLNKHLTKTETEPSPSSEKSKSLVPMQATPYSIPSFRLTQLHIQMFLFACTHTITQFSKTFYCSKFLISTMTKINL